MTPTETKELLIKAARANGIECHWEHDRYLRIDGQKKYWEPLTNPGDCFIACAKLDIRFSQPYHLAGIIAKCGLFGKQIVEMFADHLTPGRTLDEAKVAAACMAAVRCMALLCDSED